MRAPPGASSASRTSAPAWTSWPGLSFANPASQRSSREQLEMDIKGTMTSGVITADSVRELREAFSGQGLTAGDPGYEDARRIHNGLIDKRPAVIARCANTADAVEAVNLG